YVTFGIQFEVFTIYLCCRECAFLEGRLAISRYGGYLGLGCVGEGLFIGGRLITDNHFDDGIIARKTGYDRIDSMSARRDHRSFFFVEKYLDFSDITSEVLAVEQDFVPRPAFLWREGG